MLAMRVRIPPEGMDISCECSVVSDRDLCVGLITHPEESYRVWCVWVSTRSVVMRRPRLARDCCIQEEKNLGGGAAVEASWNVMAHAQKTYFVFRRNGRVHLNPQGRQFSRLLTAEVCASAVVILDTPCSEVVWRVLAIHSILQVPLLFPSRASPWAITFHPDSTINLPTAVTVLCSAVQRNVKSPITAGVCTAVNFKKNYFLNNATVKSGRRKHV